MYAQGLWLGLVFPACRTHYFIDLATIRQQCAHVPWLSGYLPMKQFRFISAFQLIAMLFYVDLT